MNAVAKNRLFELGAHVGARVRSESRYIFYYTVGRRRDRFVLNMNLTILVLRRACLFMKKIGEADGNVLFFYSELYKDPHAINYALSSIVYTHGHSVVNKRWSPGMLSNYFTTFRTVMSLIIPEFRSYRQLGVKWMLFTILLYLTDIKVPEESWEKHILGTLKFWRLLAYFKAYRVYNKVSDVLVLVNPKLDYSAAVETFNCGVVTIGTVDSDARKLSLSFGIPSNDDSIIIALFYFTLFMRAYKDGKTIRYRKFLFPSLL